MAYRWREETAGGDCMSPRMMALTELLWAVVPYCYYFAMGTLFGFMLGVGK